MADSYTVTTQGADVQGTNNTGIATNHIVQYPKPPRRDDGKWMAIGGMVGGLFGLLYDQDKLDDASDAEDNWESLTNRFRDKGLNILDTHAEKLIPCTDRLFEKLCALAECGYVAQYDQIRRMARADATLATERARAEACRTARRYNVGLNSDVYASLLRTEVESSVTATVAANMQERQNAIQVNWEMVTKAVQLHETAYMNRVQLGADLVASAGENYAYLAESMRKTAKENTGDWTSLGVALGLILPMLFNFGCPADSYCDTCEPPEEGGTGSGTGP